MVSHRFLLVAFLLMVTDLYLKAGENWFFLPNFHLDIRGIESTPEEELFYDAPPQIVRKTLESGSSLTNQQRSQVYWHPARFPHRDFVNLMPENNVFGWYGCNFDVPDELSGMDVIVDLGIIDDSDETFVNGRLIGKTGCVPNGSAWQVDRLYRIPSGMLRKQSNYLAVHVWSLWGLGGIVGPPLLKAAIASEDVGWDLAVIQEKDVQEDGLNNALTVEEAMRHFFAGGEIGWRKTEIPWKGYMNWKDDEHYSIFRTNFNLLQTDNMPMKFTKPVVMDAGLVFDTAAFYMNGKRIALVGRFPESGGIPFTEAAQRAQFIIAPEDWAEDGRNELLAIVYRERGVGGVTGIPGIVLQHPLSSIQSSSVEDMTALFNVFLQSMKLHEAAAVLEQFEFSNAREQTWLFSNKAILNYLTWLDSGKRDNDLLDKVLESIAEIFSNIQSELPKQSAMQAFCSILRHAESNERLMAQVKKYFPFFGDCCKYLQPDRETLGDWLLLYGNRKYVLAAFGKVADWSGGMDDEHFPYFLSTSNSGEPARYWQPVSSSHVSDTSALVMPFPKFVREWGGSQWLEEYAKSGWLFNGKKMRRAAWWDDHGEMHPFDDEGPNLSIDLGCNWESGQQLSLYLCDFDWRMTLHPRQQSIIVHDDKGRFINACWSGKSDLGVYERFIFNKNIRPRLTVSKHRGACVAVSGLFVNSLSEPQLGEMSSADGKPLKFISDEVSVALKIVADAEKQGCVHFSKGRYIEALKSILKLDDMLSLLETLAEVKDIKPLWMCLALERFEHIAKLEDNHEYIIHFRRISEKCRAYQPIPLQSVMLDMIKGCKLNLEHNTIKTAE